MKVKLKLQKEIEINPEDFKEDILEYHNDSLEDENQITDLGELEKVDIVDYFKYAINSFDFDIDETDITVEVLP